MQKIISLVMVLGALAIIVLPSSAYASRPIIENYVPQTEIAGQGRISYLFWDICDATLYAPSGSWQQDAPYALSLTYLRSFEGADIAKQSIKEIRAQGFDDEDTLLAWQKSMEAIFPDVDENAVLTGIRNAQGHTIFYDKSQKLGVVKDPEFTKRFFGIWLSPQTSQPKLRKKLLGDKA